ncbi:MAG TPA: alanine--glyoxylate aminotransferase family protein [Limnochordia bacterium]
MIPGPTDYHPAVLAEMSRPMVSHYGAEWAATFAFVQAQLGQVLGTESEPFLYAGSGHLGIDAAFHSLFEPGERIIVVENGHFGQRLSQIARSHGLDVTPLAARWGEPLPPAALRAALAASPDVRAVALVHLETSSGMLNPLPTLAAIVKEAGRLLIVDAVSSAGLAPVDADACGVDVLITASQKGLGAPPGLVVVSVSEAAWAAMRARHSPITGWYNNLLLWREYAETQRGYQPYFITMPVNIVRALQKSLEMILSEGLAARFERHAALANRFRAGLEALGLELVAARGYGSPGVTAIRCPPGLSASRWRDELLATTGILVAPGLGPEAERVLRVGHMGYNARWELLDRLLDGIERSLRGRSGSSGAK